MVGQSLDEGKISDIIPGLTINNLVKVVVPCADDRVVGLGRELEGV